MKTDPHVVIVLLTCNQKDYTLDCLKSLSNLEYDNLSSVIVDNNSSDSTIEAILEKYPQVHIVKNDYNAGVAGGRNCGIAYAEEKFDYKYMLILDNDTTVEVDSLKLMVKTLENDANIGVVSPKIFLMGEGKILDQAGGSVVNFYTGSTAKRGFGQLDTGQYDEIQTQDCLPSGACSLSRRDVLVRCSGLDEVFNPYGFEDLDYSLRVKKAGYKLWYEPKAVIYHKGNKTGFSTYTASYANIKGRHLKTFMHRHATLFQLGCFYGILPALGLRTLFREVKRGNGAAVFRLFLAFAGLTGKKK